MPILNAKTEDAKIGANLKRMRLLCGMSQEALGYQLGLTFQQIQKYEKGINRISGARLTQIARLFGVTTDTLCGFVKDDTAAPVDDAVMRLGTSREGIDLAVAFGKIEKPALRRAIVAMVEQVVIDGMV